LRRVGWLLLACRTECEPEAGKVAKLEIVSTVGGKLRMLNPWTEKLVERETKRGEKLEMKP